MRRRESGKKSNGMNPHILWHSVSLPHVLLSFTMSVVVFLLGTLVFHSISHSADNVATFQKNSTLPNTATNAAHPSNASLTDNVPTGSVKHEREVSEDKSANFLRPVLEKSSIAFQNNLKARSRIKLDVDCTNRRCNGIFKMSYLAPMYPCPFELHVGEWGEGGKWLCNIPGAIPNDTAIVYSIGSNGDPGFERAMYENFGVKSHTFDPTLNPKKTAAVTNLSYLEFHPIGLVSPNDNSLRNRKITNLMRIEEIMEMLGHKYADVFKIDCEGCERSFARHLLSLTTREKPILGQIQMEIHNLEKKFLLPVMEALESLGYRLFHVEPNFLCSKCMELAYIHETLTLA